jgi:hypothetical protein
VNRSSGGGISVSASKKSSMKNFGRLMFPESTRGNKCTKNRQSGKEVFLPPGTLSLSAPKRKDPKRSTLGDGNGIL